MFKLQSASSVGMTRDLAVEIAGLKRVPGERPISHVRLAHLGREIDQGLLTAFRWVTAEISGEIGRYRINGQHTSHLFSTSREPQGVVILEHYKCDDMADIVSLWSRYDASFSTRTKTDVLNAAFSNDDALQALPKVQSRIAASAAAMHEYGFGSNQVSHFERASAAIKHKAFVEWACGVFSHHSKCLRSGVFVAAFKTYQDDAREATVFWQRVQDGADTDPQSPSRVLQMLLLEYSASSGRGALSGKKSLTWQETAELSLKAWEAHKRGARIKSLRLSAGGIGKYIPQLASKAKQVAV